MTHLCCSYDAESVRYLMIKLTHTQQIWKTRSLPVLVSSFRLSRNKDCIGVPEHGCGNCLIQQNGRIFVHPRIKLRRKSTKINHNTSNSQYCFWTRYKRLRGWLVPLSYWAIQFFYKWIIIADTDCQFTWMFDNPEKLFVLKYYYLISCMLVIIYDWNSEGMNLWDFFYSFYNCGSGRTMMKFIILNITI